MAPAQFLESSVPEALHSGASLTESLIHHHLAKNGCKELPPSVGNAVRLDVNVAPS